MSACLSTALAGCSGSETNQSPPDEGTLVTDYTAATARAPESQPPIVTRQVTDDGAGNAEEASTTAEPVGFHTIESEDDASAIEVADDATDAAAVRRLLAETDYERESVLISQTQLGECYRLEVNYVGRDANGTPDVDFCQVVRDAETACDRDARDHVAMFVRLPFPGDEYSGFSHGGGGSCGKVPEEYRTEGES
ncbi:MAG: hypothetical protein ACOCSD_01300 [Halolamina sp.]